MSSEYGWSDETIFDLPLCRFRQITAAIQQRKFLQARAENSRFSWLARTLATYTVNGYMATKAEKDKVFDEVRKIAFDDVEAMLAGVAPNGSAPQESGPVDPQEAVARALEKNKAGSFERFMMMNGQMNQRGKMI